jgi:hypothetical protein
MYSISSCEYVVGKNKIHKYEKTFFHAFSLGNELTNSNLELSNVWWFEKPKVVLPKPTIMNHLFYIIRNFVDCLLNLMTLYVLNTCIWNNNWPEQTLGENWNLPPTTIMLFQSTCNENHQYYALSLIVIQIINLWILIYIIFWTYNPYVYISNMPFYFFFKCFENNGISHVHYQSPFFMP